MANIFHMNQGSFAEPIDNSDKNYQIPSVAYVNALVKQIEDIINSTSTESGNALARINFDKNITGVYLQEQDETTNELTEDFNHRTLTEAQIDIFKSKVSKLDLNVAIEKLRAELKTYYEAQFNQLLNDKNVLSKIKDISYMIKEEATINTLMDVLASKIDEEKFNEHTSSNAHLNNADRNALNQLIKMIQLGGMDWAAKDGEVNAIKNKPTSMTADGGNADTVKNYTIDRLLNHQMDDFIVGKVNTFYEASLCDAIVTDEPKTDDDVDFDNIIKTINYKGYGMYGFRSGEYYTENASINKSKKHIIIHGSGTSNTVFAIDSLKVNDYVEFRDLTIKNSDIYIGSNTIFDNVQFDNCKICFKSSGKSIVRNCMFNRCVISIDGAFIDNVFTNNILASTFMPVYYGGNNLISNNISY